jgi:hypothetical protein
MISIPPVTRDRYSPHVPPYAFKPYSAIQRSEEGVIPMYAYAPSPMTPIITPVPHSASNVRIFRVPPRAKHSKHNFSKRRSDIG